MTADVDALKRAAAHRALEYVREGDVVGLGTGSTAELFVEALGRRAAHGLRVTGVATSHRTEELARRLGIPLADLGPETRPRIAVDGADEIVPETLHVLKGHGGALLREKMVAAAAEQVVLVADDSKLVPRLACNRPVPVEVVRFGWRHTAAALARLGCEPARRMRDGAPFVSDEGHYILDCRFPPLDDPAAVAARIKTLVGVVEHGLFVGLVHRVVVASADGLRIIER